MICRYGSGKEAVPGFLLPLPAGSLRGSEMDKTQPFYEMISDDPELVQWSITVKVRDFYTCRHCGQTDRKLLDAHHIKPISQYPELKYSGDNGITYCMWCHAWQGHKKSKPMREKILTRYAIALHLKYVRPTD